MAYIQPEWTNGSSMIGPLCSECDQPVASIQFDYNNPPARPIPCGHAGATMVYRPRESV